MELYQLRTFLTVAAEKSVTRAARRLFTTPPSISGHIRALEEEWQVTLFRRTASGMEITEKGRELRAKAEATLLAAQDLTSHATELQGCHLGTISLGVNCGLDHLRVPKLIDDMWTTCPGVDLRIVQGTSGRIAEDLEREVLDAGFLFGQGSPTLISHRLTTAQLLVAAPKEWETKILAASWEEISELPWIHSGGCCPFQLVIDGKFAERGLQQRKGLYADDDATRIELLASGVGMAILQRTDAMRAVDAGQAVIWPTELMECDLSFAYLAGRKDDPLIRSMRISVAREWGMISDVRASKMLKV